MKVSKILIIIKSNRVEFYQLHSLGVFELIEINLLQSLPKSNRNILARAKARNMEVIQTAKRFGIEYFDGHRKFGYGGYVYDGRWLPVAEQIISHYKLKSGMRVLDIGCAKGFLVKDLMHLCPGLEVFGIDVSEYALLNCEPEVLGRLHLGSADKLAFPNKSFDLVLSINTLHNLQRERVINALKEIERVSKTNSFIQVDSYFTQNQKEKFEKWVLTAEFHDFPEGWLNLFRKAGYTGDYFWTVVD